MKLPLIWKALIQNQDKVTWKQVQLHRLAKYTRFVKAYRTFTMWVWKLMRTCMLSNYYLTAINSNGPTLRKQKEEPFLETMPLLLKRTLSGQWVTPAEWMNKCEHQSLMGGVKKLTAFYISLYLYVTCSLAKILRVLAWLLLFSQSHRTTALAGTSQVLGQTPFCLGSWPSVHAVVGMTMHNIRKPCRPTELDWAQMPAEQMPCEWPWSRYGLLEYGKDGDQC